MCLDDQILNTYMDGELAEPWKTQVEEHLSYCPACKARYEQLLALHKTIAGAELTDAEIKPHQEKVLSYIKNNYLDKNKKVSFFHRKLKVGIPAIITAAAAFVVVFIGAFVLFGTSGEQTAQIIPGMTMNVDGSNIMQVRASDNITASKTLDSYTLEEILQYLDGRGFEVDVRIKGISPLAAPVKEAEPVVEPVVEEILPEDVSAETNN